MRRTGPRKTGFEAEWREISFSTVDGDLINRVEIFDEADLDAALARFDELSRPAPRLENAASQVCERLNANFSARDWDAMSQVVAHEHARRRSSTHGERRRPTRSGHPNRQRSSRRGDGADTMTSTVIAIRGERLALVVRHSSSRSAARGIPHRIARRRRDRRRRADWWPTSHSISTTSTPPSRNSTPGTSPAKRRPTRTRGRSSQGPSPRSTGANSPRRRPDWVNIDHRRRSPFAPAS